MKNEKSKLFCSTAHGTQLDKEEAKKLGGFDFLRKPADIDLLLAKIKEAFSEKLSRFMTAIAFAQGGDIDEARKIIKKEQ